LLKNAYLCLNLFIEMELSIEEAKKLIEALPVYKSITDLEREIKLPKNSLQQFLKGKRKFPKKWVKPFQNYFKVGDKKAELKVVEEKKETPSKKEEKKRHPLWKEGDPEEGTNAFYFRYNARYYDDVDFKR